MAAHTFLHQLLRALAPRARRRVTWRAAAPFLGWLAIYAGAVAWCEGRGALRFTRPEAFWLTGFTLWIWWLHLAGNAALSPGRALAALLARLTLAGLFIITLAEPRAVRRSETRSVIYALDVSDSMGSKVSDQALSWVLDTVTTKPARDEAGLVVFGRDAAVELPPRQSFPFEAINSRISRDGSDLARALNLAAAMLPAEHDGRIVLLSDGNETEGNLGSTLDELKARGVAVDVLPVSFDFPREVWLERLDLPRVVKAGETYEAGVVVNSLAAGRGTLVLSENGRIIFEQPVEYGTGKTRLTLPIYLRAPGYYEYSATLKAAPGEDGWTENNVAIGEVFLRGEGQVLLVTDARSDARDWEPLVAALKAAERVVQVQMAYEFPRDALSLRPYDLVILANAPADSFDALQLQALRDAVYHHGTGFLMLGGPQSFGPGGYHGSAVEEALPVTMDVTQKKVLPKGALAIILHTCEFPEGNTWAKRIAKEALRVLGAQDEAGLIAYGWSASATSGYDWIFPLTPAGQMEKLVPLINAAEPGDMPDFQTPMQLGLKGLQASDAAQKHLIVISDGDPSPPTPALVQQFVNDKISVSMIAINPHGGQDISIMQSIAATTGGRYYFPQNPAELPSIFIKEAKTLKRSMLQNKVFTPEVQLPSPILKGLDALPPLRGYVLTTVKPRATTILRTPADPASPEELDPVLATWRFGLGATGAWTSDLGPVWAGDWLGWEKYRPFVKQLAIELSRVEQASDLRLETFAAGHSGTVTIEDFAKEEAFLRVEGRVVGPDGQSQALELRQIGPRRYQASFPLRGKGRYQVVAAATGRPGQTEPERVLGGFAVPYSPEYLRFRSDSRVLQEIARQTGGRVLSATDREVFGGPRRIRETSLPVFDWFLIALACLLPLDIAVRRVQLDWAAIRQWFTRRPTEDSTVTMNALLRRKRDAIPAPTAVPPARPSPVAPTAPNERPPQAPPPASPTPPEPDREAPLSTTERLLARKRRQHREDSPPDA